MPTKFDSPPLSLSPVQERGALSIGSGSTITGAAQDAGLHRATVYRRLKASFAAAVQQARTGFILARRDDPHYLSNRAMNALLAIHQFRTLIDSALLETVVISARSKACWKRADRAVGCGPGGPPYSYRKTSAGAMRVALRAG